MHSAKEAIRMAQESANEESKSSAGDKYETGRAMAQLEIENASGQLAEARRLMQALEQIPETPASDVIRPGSLVYTDQGNYFISIAAGKLDLDGTVWYAVSPASPVGASLLGLHAGDVQKVNKKDILISVVA